MNKDMNPVESELTLAADFPEAAHDQWLKLVDKVLGGAPFEKKLVSRTYDGISLQPLYTRSDWNAEGDPSGLPGGAPYTRGGKVLPASLGGWDVRQYLGHPDPAVANKQILEELEKGVTSIFLNATPTRGGVHVQTVSDLDRIFDNVLLDLAPVSIAAGGPAMAVLMMQLLEKRGNSKVFAGNFGLDPFAALARTGSLPTDLQSSLARIADVASHAASAFPKAKTINVRGYVYHSGGASNAQEIGCSLAAAVEYMRALTSAGLSADAAANQLAFLIASDADFFLSIAKIRALRKAWGRIAEVCGAEHRTTYVSAITAPRMMSQRDPWVNILRTTVACFAAGVAGADSITVLPFDFGLGVPSDLGRRIARNTQIVLQEEASLARVMDPAGGAWMFEQLTDELADKAWSFFQEIENQGGMAKALTSGFIAQSFAAVQSERAKNIAKRKDPITGVSEFPNIHEAPVGTSPTPTALPEVKPIGEVGTLPSPSDGTLTKALLSATENGANAEAINKAMAGDPLTIQPLPYVRLAEHFEQLRDAGDAFKKEFGEYPKVFLANIGKVAQFTARATFTKNFFEAGGIEAVSGAGGTDPAQIAKDFTDSKASFAAICGSDAVYGEYAGAVATALKNAGAALVYLAGKPADIEDALRTAGVNEFIFMGCNAHDILADAHKRLKAGR